jgi:hypothetical protein
MVVNGIINQKSVRVICPLKLIYTAVQITVLCRIVMVTIYRDQTALRHNVFGALSGK